MFWVLNDILTPLLLQKKAIESVVSCQFDLHMHIKYNLVMDWEIFEYIWVL